MSPDPAAEAPIPRPGDDGVLDRVRRRNTVAAVLFGLVVVVFALTAVGWPGWATDDLGPLTVALLGTAVLAGPAVLLTGRARRWTAAANLDPAHGVPAVLGRPVPLHPLRPGQPIRRRYPASLLPVRADLDGLRDGAALVLHARPDKVLPEAGDRCTIIGRGTGPFLVRDPATGAVFAAEKGPLSVV